MVKKQILNKVLKNAPRSHFAPGLIFLASEDGDILYKTAIGHHTYDPSSPKVNFKTIYDIASITKAIVATGALLLIDQGKLKLSGIY